MTDSNSIGSQTRRIMNHFGISPKKNLGQNFLIDGHVLKKIIASAEICKDDLVFEAGPGIGTLTRALAEQAGRVVAVELDSGLIPVLESELGEYPNVQIIHGDILKTNIASMIKEYDYKQAKFVANLPYYITTPIIMGLLESSAGLSHISVMVQKEVAKRMCAAPGTKDYGALSLAVAYYAEADIAANVPCNCFIPRPAVDSAVIRLRPRDFPPVSARDAKLMFEIVRAAFSMRRKTLINCLYSAELEGRSSLSKERLREIIAGCGLNAEIRGESLTLAEFGALADAITLEPV